VRAPHVLYHVEDLFASSFSELPIYVFCSFSSFVDVSHRYLLYTGCGLSVLPKVQVLEAWSPHVEGWEVGLLRGGAS
jgi:hypothetical protein